MSKGLTLTALEVENVKRIKAVRIEPEGNVIVVGGNNGNGKTSLLDSIEWLINGKPSQRMTVRRGETKSRIAGDLGDLKVTRTTTVGDDGTENSYLTVANAEGMKYSSPQAVLNRLLGEIAFDPLEFTRLKPAEQLGVLRAVLGLDEAFAQIEAARKEAYDERTLVHRQQKELGAKLADLPEFDGLPETELSSEDIGKRYQEALAKNTEAENHALQVESASKEVVRLNEYHQSTLREIADFELRLKNLRERADAQEQEIETAKAAEDALIREPVQTVDTTAIEAELQQVEDTNRKIRQNRAKAEGRESWAKLEARRVDLEKTIDACDKNKADAVAKAKLPIEGLYFDEDGLTFNGVPFEQASSAEQLKVSFALVAAQNPRLKVALIRDGSLLDSGSLKVIAQIADAAGFQVWIERVGKGKECTVIIEDGELRPALATVEGGAK